MKILIVNTNERHGGAAIAANRLAKALNNLGVNTTMLVGRRQSSTPFVVQAGPLWMHRLRFAWERFVIWTANLFSMRNLFAVSIANTGHDITATREFQEADVVHLHWVNQGMLSLRDIRRIVQSGKPVVWTLHDMWPLTAICHHAHDCERYTSACAMCPQLRFPSRRDLSARVFRRKQKMLAEADLRVVAVSGWLRDKVRASALLGSQQVEVIPNSIALSAFRQLDYMESRSALSLTRRHIIAFGAARIDDPIKGFPLFVEALADLLGRGTVSAADIQVLLFGRLRDKGVLDTLPVAYSYMGYVGSEADLSEIYSAADVIVSSSYYETFGQTLIEAQACGCVPVSFAGSGQTDIIRHKQNGYLADRLSTRSLADGMEWALTTPHNRRQLRSDVACRYSSEAVATRYIRLYQSLTADRPTTD